MHEKNQTKSIRVIASVIARNSKYLVCQRPSHKRYGELWEFPGGKIREGETNLDAAQRELGEELGVEVVNAGKLLFKAKDPGSQYSIEFVEVEIKGKPMAIEHSEIRWCNMVELSHLSFAPADTRFVKEYLIKEDQ